jgi:phospholipid-binding lipoprotein MlaA
MIRFLNLKHFFPVGRTTGCLILLAALLAGCTTASKGPIPEKRAAVNPVDPYENINRKIYAFNDMVDDYVAKPISDTYKYITPEFVRTGISNFFSNLDTINVIFNDLLQAKFRQSERDARRFLMNTTLGLAGFLDVASTVGLDEHEEDFEQTLAVWGMPQGPYLVIPFLGPLTGRGIPGAIFDTAANPITYVGAPLLSNYIGAPIQGLSLINRRANAEGSLKFIDEAALDPYVFTRESFLQWRDYLANDGQTQFEPDFFDIENQNEEGK